jgi:hypothetical protein
MEQEGQMSPDPSVTPDVAACPFRPALSANASPPSGRTMSRLPRRSTSVNQIVAAVLSRDPAYPPGPVRRYVEYLLEIPILMGRLETSQ